MNKELLEVGDVVYRTNRVSDSITKITISRTTKTLAIGSGHRFKIGLGFEGRVFESGKNTLWNSNSFTLANKELNNRYKVVELRSEIFRLLNSPTYKTLTLPQLLSIKKTLTLPDEDLAIWIKVEDLDKDNLPAGNYIGINGEFYVGYIELEGEEVSLVYNNGESIMYPTHIISTLALLHIPNHPLPTQKPLTQKEEDVVKVEDEVVRVINNLNRVAEEFEDDGDLENFNYYRGKAKAYKELFEGNTTLSQLLKLPTKTSTK